VAGSVVGTPAARTVTFNATYLDSLPGVLELRGAKDELLARVSYRFSIQNDAPAIEFRVRGLALAVP
jgi:hypothetical protein